jgi:surfeit locus 1 family protein
MSTASAAPRRFPIVITIATAIALAVLVGLGAWQVQRLHWKQGLLAQIAARQKAAPQPLGAVLARGDGADLEFTRVRAQCPGLASAPYVELYALREGQSGVRLVSACRLEGRPYDAVLVDRGFIAQEISARPPVRDDARPVPVAGVLRAGGRAGLFTPAVRGRLWYARDIPAMASALKVSRPAPYMLAAETSSNPEWKALVPTPLPGDIPNNHLGYAITWFGLAGALIAVYLGVVLKRRRNGRP